MVASIAFWLTIIGGINWGLIGFSRFDLVAAILGAMSPAARVVYALVGLSALYSAFAVPTILKRVAPVL